MNCYSRTTHTTEVAKSGNGSFDFVEEFKEMKRITSPSGSQTT
jgi:hypothetical protein